MNNVPDSEVPQSAQSRVSHPVASRMTRVVDHDQSGVGPCLGELPSGQEGRAHVEAAVDQYPRDVPQAVRVAKESASSSHAPFEK